ncbi:glycosyltransferase family 4 protein [Cohnella cellulosilytica]|uniref:Glycosyltransferase family 4 protein n=1 Tax=Cohnella cellulosilytica TaxID=986710 RepID=A0ABW2FK10_9BACL
MIPILYIQPYASRVGGVDTVLLELVAGLDKSRFRPFVVLPGPSPYAEKYQAIGAEVRFAPVAVFGKPRGWSYYFVNLARLIASVRALRAIVRKEKIALIHSHKMEAMGGNLLGKWMGIPTVQTVHELPRRPLLAYKFMAWLNHLFNDLVIVLCDQSASMFEWRSRKSAKVRKIYNGIRLRESAGSAAEAAEVPGSSPIRQALGIGPEEKLVVTVARLAPMKGIEYLIDAARLLLDERKDVKFVIVGDVAFEEDLPYKERLLNRAASLGLSGSVHFLGLRRDVDRILAEADAFALPSVYDIFPTVILEAMNAGLPVVATDVGGVPEMVRGEYGLLVPPADPLKLKDALNELLRLDCKAMGRAAQETLRAEFTREIYVDKTVRLYEELLRPGLLGGRA